MIFWRNLQQFKSLELLHQNKNLKLKNMKNLFTVALTLFASIIFAQKANYQLSSHILDVSKGVPGLIAPVPVCPEFR